MNNKFRLPLLLSLALLGFAVHLLAANHREITYQGRLTVGGGNPDPGELFDFRFDLFDAPTGGIQFTDTLTHLSVPCPDGLFTVPLDFGSNVFTGAPRWLEIAVRPATNNPAAPYAVLSPRQHITSAPQAIHAAKADLVADGSVRFEQLAPDAVGNINLQDGAVTAAKIANSNVVRSLAGLRDQIGVMTSPGLELTTVGNDLSVQLKLAAGNGIGLTPIGNEIQIGAATTCGSAYSNCFWNLLGNGNVADGVNFLGTINNVPLTVRVNHQRALLIVPAATANLIGGHPANSVVSPAVGGHIGGGGEAASPNTILESWGTIGGGSGHSIHNKALYAAIGGGLKNTISTNSSYTVIGGGDNNTIRTNSPYATIAGGSRNLIEQNARYGTLSGGAANTIGTNAPYATIGGGTNNAILMGANGSSILGGEANTIHVVSSYSSIGGGIQNLIEANSDQATIAGGSANAIRPNADFATVGGGATNWIATTAPFATIPGGQAAAATHYGQLAYASGQFSGNGDAQLSLHVLRRSIPTAMTAELFLDGDAATRRLVLPAEASWAFDVLVVGRADAGQSAGYRITGIIKNVAGVPSLVGVPMKIVLAEDFAGWDAFVEADVANDALAIKVVGDVVPSRWVATVRTSEVIY